MDRLNTTKRSIFKFVLFCSMIFACFACSDSEAQQDFEDEAFQPPAGIMETNASGDAVENGETDSSDWNIAPNFSGLVRIETPAYPNPVAYNSSFEIQVNVIGVDAVNGLYIYAFRQPSELASLTPLRFQEGALQPGLQSFVISPQEFAPSGGTGTIGNTWRIILFDGRQNIISYGDVLVD